MISYLIDGVLLTALAGTSIQVALMYREIRKLRRHDGEYRDILEETGEALEDVESALRDLNAHGAQVVMALGNRIDRAQATIGELDERVRAARGAFAQVDAMTQRPFLAYPASETVRASPSVSLSRRFEIDAPSSAYAAPASGSRPRARLAAPRPPRIGGRADIGRLPRELESREAGGFSPRAGAHRAGLSGSHLLSVEGSRQ